MTHYIVPRSLGAQAHRRGEPEYRWSMRVLQAVFGLEMLVTLFLGALVYGPR